VALENCHPFVRELWGQYWVFAHNGDLKEFAPCWTALPPVGSTDSERRSATSCSSARRFGEQRPLAALRSCWPLVHEIATHGTFNMMLSSGGELFAHCSTNLVYLVRQHRLTRPSCPMRMSAWTSPGDHAQRPGGHHRHPAADHQRTMDGVQPGELKLFIDGPQA
jgi:glutamine amidotransferase